MKNERKPLLLIVDDNPQNLQVLGSMLRNNGYKVVVAQNGIMALEFARSHQPECILLDIMMPEMDGIETCRKLKTLETVQDIAVIFITGLIETQNKIEAFEAGGVDYITKPFQTEEVLARVKTHIALRHMHKRLQEQNRQLQQEITERTQAEATLFAAHEQLKAQNSELLRQKQELNQDLKAAANIQQSLLPQTPPEIRNVRFAWQFMPCSTIGGDIFHIHQLDASHVVMYLVDVSGHGVSSAMVTVPVSQTLSLNPNSLIKRAIARPPYYEIVPPLEVLRGLDREYPLERFDHYFTIVYLILNLQTGQIQYSKAGHPEPVLVRNSGDIELLAAGGPLIGMGKFLPFEEETITLQPHDRLFLYTDGITECFNQYKHMYGEERLQEELLKTRHEPLERSCVSISSLL